MTINLATQNRLRLHVVFNQFNGLRLLKALSSIDPISADCFVEHHWMNLRGQITEYSMPSTHNCSEKMHQPPAFHDLPILQYQDAIGVHDGGEPVSHND